MRYLIFIILVLNFIVGCGSENETSVSASTAIDLTKGVLEQADLGVYVGTNQVTVVTPDGLMHDQLWQMYTTRVSQGVYARFFNANKYTELNTYGVNLIRMKINNQYVQAYQNGLYLEGTCYVEIYRLSNPSLKDQYTCYVPGQIYY